MKKILTQVTAPLLTLLLLGAFSSASANGDDNISTAHFSIDQCESYGNNGSNMDYSEFVADITNNPEGASISIVGDHLYRTNPTENKHSCTPGVAGSNAMCFSADQSCDFDPDSDRALRIDVEVTPGANGYATFQGLSFYEQSIPDFIWIDGPSGDNDYPLLYGITVKKDGEVIYSSDSIATSMDWTLEEFVFATNSAFTVTEATIFNVELLGYCPVGNNANVSVWDIDEVIVMVSDQDVSGGTLEGGPFEFCVGDEEADNIADGAITLTGASGENGQWIVTDDQGNILGLPPTYSVVDFDGAGTGTCLVWYLRYNGEITGLEAGANAADLEGCYSLSNSISVVRNQPEGGTLEGGPFEFCVGDDEADNLMPGDITLTGNSGSSSQWIVTDEQGNILGLPPMPSVVDFDGAGPGTCLIWHLSFDGDLVGAEVGMNAADLEGCYSLSNSISVFRNQPEGGTLEGGPFEFCVGDDEADNLMPGDITLTGNSGSNSQWVVTDEQGNILGLPPMPSVVDFDGAGPGTCLIWHLSFDGELIGAEVGMNAADLEGCFSLSNSIAVVRNQPEGGTLEGGPFEFCVGDGEADNLMPGDITLTGNSGSNSQWIVTDEQGNILGLPPMPSVVDFDGAGPGTCLIWHLSFDGDLVGAEVGMNAADLEGCYSLSNSISVVRNQPEGGTLEGGPFEFCVGDGEADNLMPGDITLTGNSGSNSQWVVTDEQGNILGLPPMPSVVDFDGAGLGTCLVWNLSYYGEVEGLEMGMNASDLVGCFSLSNSVAVNRIDCTAGVAGGVIEGGPFEFCVDGEADNVSGITLSGNTGMNNQWIITDEAGQILGLPPMPGVVDFDAAGPGICLIWHLSYDGDIEGLEMGMNANDLEGDYGLSNSISVTRNQPEGGTLEGGPFEFCVGDGEADQILDTEITLTGEGGENTQWIVTDDQGNILGLPPMISVVDFDDAGAGTCLIWNLSHYGEVTGLEMGMNANDLEGCFSLSNSLEVVRVSGDDCTGGRPLISSQISLYPNPAREYITVDMQSNNKDTYTIDIINIFGELVIREESQEMPVDHRIFIDDLHTGRYMMRVYNSKTTAVSDFIIAR